jgi:polar amino acid transport system permease protein
LAFSRRAAGSVRRYEARIMTGGFTTNHLIYLFNGLIWTVVLSALAFALGGVAGFFVMLARTSTMRWLRRLSLLYVQFIQGTPLLILMFV